MNTARAVTVAPPPSPPTPPSLSSMNVMQMLQPWILTDDRIRAALTHMQCAPAASPSSSVAVADSLRPRIPANPAIGHQEKDEDKEKDKDQDRMPRQRREQPLAGQLVVPREWDTLFWCWEMIWLGKDEVDMVHCRNRLAELRRKAEYADVVQQRSSLLHVHHLGASVHDIVHNLAQDANSKLRIPTFLAMAIAHGVNVCVWFANDAYFLHLFEEDEPIHLVRQQPHAPGTFGWVATTFVQRDALPPVQMGCPRIETLAQPIGAPLSKCTIAQLRTLARQCHLEHPMDIAKRELYTRLHQHLMMPYQSHIAHGSTVATNGAAATAANRRA